MTVTMSSSDFEETKENRKVTEFSYLLQRKCFRMMRRYYKHKFQNCGIFTNYKKQIRQIDLTELNDAIRKFVRMEFGYLNSYTEFRDYIQLERSLKIIILCDRYNKKEDIITGLDFTVLRNVLNKFNTRNLINFYSEGSFAFLFMHYYENFSEKDAMEQNDVEPDKLKEELQVLYHEANKYSDQQMSEFRTHLKQQECSDFLMEDNEVSLFQDF